MNTRDYKQFAPDEVYHIYNRGHNKQDIFLSNADYVGFLNRLAILVGRKNPDEAKYRLTPFDPSDFSILAYVLLPNHYHLLIKQNNDVTIDRLIAKLATSYAKEFNLKNKREGGVFRSKFRAKHCGDEKYFLTLSAYIHLNPPNPLEYKYSSIHEYKSGNFMICDPATLSSYYKSYKEYERFLKPYIKSLQNRDFEDMLS